MHVALLLGDAAVDVLRTVLDIVLAPALLVHVVVLSLDAVRDASVLEVMDVLADAAVSYR